MVLLSNAIGDRIVQAAIDEKDRFIISPYGWDYAVIEKVYDKVLLINALEKCEAFVIKKIFEAQLNCLVANL